MHRISKLNIQCDPVNCKDPPNYIEFLKEKSLRKRANNGTIMLDSDSSNDDTLSSSKRVR